MVRAHGGLEPGGGGELRVFEQHRWRVLLVGTMDPSDVWASHRGPGGCNLMAIITAIVADPFTFRAPQAVVGTEPLHPVTADRR
jgi:hypothetical protein